VADLQKALQMLVISADIHLKEGRSLGEPTLLLATIRAASKDHTKPLKDIFKSQPIHDRKIKNIKVSKYREGMVWRYVVTADILPDIRKREHPGQEKNPAYPI